jgi:hypothetical protein
MTQSNGIATFSALVELDGVELLGQLTAEWTQNVGATSNLSSGLDAWMRSETSKQQGMTGTLTFVAQKDSGPPSLLSNPHSATFHLISSGTADVSSAGIGDIVDVNGDAYTNAAAFNETNREWTTAAELAQLVSSPKTGVGSEGVGTTVNGDVVTFTSQFEILVLEKTEVGGTLVLADTSRTKSGNINLTEQSWAADQGATDAAQIYTTPFTSTDAILDSETAA